MTLCVASMFRDDSNGWGIVVAADRKFSVGDIGYESAAGKYLLFNKRVMCLLSGDLSAAVRILLNAQSAFGDPELATTEEVAGAVARQFREYRALRAEQVFLEPLGLTSETFVSRQQEFSPLFLHQLQTELLSASVGVEIIVAGVDEGAATLFLISDPGVATNQNAMGFAVIGEGWHHALAYFTENQNSAESFSTALYTAYAAKRVGEVANSVGAATDLMAVLPNGEWFSVVQSVQAQLELTFERVRLAQRGAVEVAVSETAELIARIRTKPAVTTVPPVGMESMNEPEEAQDAPTQSGGAG